MSAAAAPSPLAPLKASMRHRCLAGHPWVYGSELASAPEAAPGDEVDVVDARGRFVGRGAWNPRSQIAVRIVTRRPGVTLGPDLIRRRIREARARRQGFYASDDTQRLIFSEADGLPGLIVDRYGDVLVLQLLTLGMDRRRELIADLLIEEFAGTTLVERSDAPSRKHEGLEPRIAVIAGADPGEIIIALDGVRAAVRPLGGQKTGAFLDQRFNHRRFAELAARSIADGKPGAGLTVLDAFAYHGLFGIYAARAGATAVTAIESSPEACEGLRADAARNGADVEILEENAFDTLRRFQEERRRFDLISLDPPTFTRSASGAAGAARGYREINLRALRLLAPGGLLFTSSCSFHTPREEFAATLAGAIHDSGREVTLVEWRGAAPDHPVRLEIPETDYLKCAVLRAI